MLIIYCDQCKKLIPASEIKSGHAVMREDNVWLCLDCAPRKPERAAGPRASGGTAVLPPRRQSGAAAHATPLSHSPAHTPAQKAPQPGSQTGLVVGLCAAGVVLAIVAVVLLSSSNKGVPQVRKELNTKQTESPTPETRKSTTASPQNSTAAQDKQSQQNAPPPATPPTDATTKSGAAAAQLERQKQAEKEMEELRSRRAGNILEEHKAWFAQNPGAGWIYQTKLRQMNLSYRGTPAAAEAEQIIAAMKLPPALMGQFVRIDIPGNPRVLSLAEVEILSAGKNIAPGSACSHSTSIHDGVAQRAADGNTSGQFHENSVTHTHDQDTPWWEADLGGAKQIDSIVVWNRMDCCSDRLQNFRVQILDAARKPVWETTVASHPNPSTTLHIFAK